MREGVGGDAIDLASALLGHGLSLTVVAPVGEDADGERIRDVLNDRGVRLVAVPAPEGTLRRALVRDRSGAEIEVRREERAFADTRRSLAAEAEADVVVDLRQGIASTVVEERDEVLRALGLTDPGAHADAGAPPARRPTRTPMPRSTRRTCRNPRRSLRRARFRGLGGAGRGGGRGDALSGRRGGRDPRLAAAIRAAASGADRGRHRAPCAGAAASGSSRGARTRTRLARTRSAHLPHRHLTAAQGRTSRTECTGSRRVHDVFARIPGALGTKPRTRRVVRILRSRHGCSTARNWPRASIRGA